MNNVEKITIHRQYHQLNNIPHITHWQLTNVWCLDKILLNIFVFTSNTTVQTMGRIYTIFKLSCYLSWSSISDLYSNTGRWSCISKNASRYEVRFLFFCCYFTYYYLLVDIIQVTIKLQELSTSVIFVWHIQYDIPNFIELELLKPMVYINLIWNYSPL